MIALLIACMGEPQSAPQIERPTLAETDAPSDPPSPVEDTVDWCPEEEPYPVDYDDQCVLSWACADIPNAYGWFLDGCEGNVILYVDAAHQPFAANYNVDVASCNEPWGYWWGTPVDCPVTEVARSRGCADPDVQGGSPITLVDVPPQIFALRRWATAHVGECVGWMACEAPGGPLAVSYEATGCGGGQVNVWDAAGEPIGLARAFPGGALRIMASQEVADALAVCLRWPTFEPSAACGLAH